MVNVSLLYIYNILMLKKRLRILLKIVLKVRTEVLMHSLIKTNLLKASF